MKTLLLVLLFAVIGFFVGVFLIHQMFELGGPPLAIIGLVSALPLATAGGVVAGFYVAQRL